MREKSKKRLSKEQREDIAALVAMKDSEIDLTDMPEVLDWSRAEIGRFYRKKKIVPILFKRRGKRRTT